MNELNEEYKEKIIYGIKVYDKYIDHTYTKKIWWFSKKEAETHMTELRIKKDPDLSFEITTNKLMNLCKTKKKGNDNGYKRETIRM